MVWIALSSVTNTIVDNPRFHSCIIRSVFKGTWSFYAAVDKGESGGVSESSSGVSAARELFKNKTIRGQDIKSDADTIKTKHQRAITLIQDATPARKTGGSVSVVSTSSLDGSLVLWDLPMLNIKMSELQL